MTQPEKQPAENKAAEPKADELSAGQKSALIDVVKEALSAWQADETSRRTAAAANEPKKKNWIEQIFSDD